MSDHRAALLFQGKVQMGCRRGKMGLCSHFFLGKLNFLFQVCIALSNPSLYLPPVHLRTGSASLILTNKAKPVIVSKVTSRPKESTPAGKGDGDHHPQIPWHGEHPP